MIEPAEPEPFARPRVAAGALFLNDAGDVLLVRPTYKDHWDLPGGYVEAGESPHAACIREIQEELGIPLQALGLLVTDWAPSDAEGDKILFVFDGGRLIPEQIDGITLPEDELAEWRYIAAGDLDQFVTDRLTRRITTAIDAQRRQRAVFAEHGLALATKPATVRSND
jgi:8-oxo-dGTP diphosphatase